MKGGDKLTRLKEVRLNLGITRKELADLTNIPIRTLESYEQGLRCLNKANISTVLTLSKALEIEPEELLK